MKVVGSFNPAQLYMTRQDNTKVSSSFAAMLAFNIGNDRSTDDVTAVVGSSTSEVMKLYEEMTGKTVCVDNQNESEDQKLVFAFWSKKTTVSNNLAEWWNAIPSSAIDDWVPPTKQVDTLICR